MTKSRQVQESGSNSGSAANSEVTKASVFLYDAKHYARRQARVALNTLGFWSIVDTHELERVPELLNEKRYQLVVAGIADIDDGVADLVREIRLHSFGKDPFVPIILTAWSPSTELVTTALNSGADDLLIWPFSINQLGGRIATLIRTRKKFVITDSYLGPDRRWGSGRIEKFDTVEVPNALKAKVNEEPAADASDSAIKSAMQRLQSEKIRSEARRINDLAESILQMHATGRGDGATNYVVLLLGLAEQLQKSIDGSRFAHLTELAHTVENVAKTLRDDGLKDGLRNLHLLEKTARALQVAAVMDETGATGTQAESVTVGKAGAQ